MNIGVFVFQWLHVIFAIFWFGSSMAMNFIFIPALNRLPLDKQREIGSHLGAVAERVLNVVGPVVIVLGVIRGTIFGPIQSLDALTSTYGITWLIALIAALATYLWAKVQIEPALARMNAIPIDQALDADGRPSSAMLAAIGVVKRNAMLELLGFLVVFTCMMLLRFGY